MQKFGGSSVADAERMRNVADYIARVQRRGDQPVVVVSAMGRETDDLIDIASKVSRTRPGREMDMLVTAGERKAMSLLCMALHDLGVAADSFTGSQAGVLTDGDHTKAKIVEVRPERLRIAMKAGRVPVVGGAQGVSLDKEVTFLGRGGSDTTAVALAKALGADACELYTDVSGVFSADPRVVPSAHRLAKVSYDEMLEMNAAGCPKPAMRSVEFQGEDRRSAPGPPARSHEGRQGAGCRGRPGCLAGQGSHLPRPGWFRHHSGSAGQSPWRGRL